MTEKKRPFVGYIISGEPVTTKKAIEAGVIKQSKASDATDEKPIIKTDNDGNNQVQSSQ